MRRRKSPICFDDSIFYKLVADINCYLLQSLPYVLKTGVKEIRIPRSDIDAIQLKRGWFGATVRVRVKSIKWLAGLPDCENGELTLHVARRDRDRAVDFVRVLSPENSPGTPAA